MSTAKVIIKGENKLSSATKSAKQDLNIFGQAAQELGKKLKKLTSFAGVTLAVKKLGDACVSCFKDFESANRKYKQLAITIGNTEAYNKAIKTITKLSKQTLSSKDDIESMVSELSALGKSSEEVDKISSAAVYLSNVTGKDLNSSMTTLLNTYNGTTTQLKKLGIDTSNFTKAELENGAAIDLVIDKFQTLSEEMSNNDSSQFIANIKNNIGDIGQSIGDLIDFTIKPALKDLSDWTSQAKDDFDNFIQNVKVVLGNFPTIWNKLMEAIKGSLSNFFSIDGIKNFVIQIGNIIISIIKGITTLVSNVVTSTIGVIEIAIDGLKDYAMYWITYLCDQAGINISGLVNDIGKWLTESTIGKFVDKIISTLVNGVKTTLALIKNIPAMVKLIANNLGDILKTLFTNIPNAIKEIFLGALDWIAQLGVAIKNSFLQGIEDALNLIIANKAFKWIAEKIFGAEDWSGVNFNIDRTGQESMKAKADAHFTAAGNSFSQIGQDLSGLNKQLEALMNPVIEEWASNSTETIGQKLAVWTAKSSEEYYEAAKDKFSSIGDFLEDWSKTFSLDFGENWGEIKEAFTGVFNSFGGDFSEFSQWLNDYISDIRIANEKAAKNTEYNADIADDIKKEISKTFINKLSEKLGTLLSQIKGVNTEQGTAAGTSIVDYAIDSIGEAGDVIKELSTNMLSMGSLLGGVVTAIKYVFEGIKEVLSPAFNKIATAILLPLREIGKALGGVFVPILELLTPVLKVFAKSIITVTGTIQYITQFLQHIVASLINWIADLSILGWRPLADLEINDPGNPGRYTDYIANKWGDVDSIFANGIGTSTGSAVTNASYSGATTIHLNVYQEGVVVGDGGIQEFAMMIREQLAELNYNGR